MGLAGWVLFVGLQAFEPPEELVELAALDVHVVAPVRSPPPPTLHIPAAQARSGALQQAALRDLLRMYAAICEPPDAGDPRHCWRTVCIEPDLFRTWAAFALASGSADCLLHYERYLRTCHPDDPDRVVVYGYSLGAIPSVEMATTNPGCALVLETPFPSLRNFAEASAAVSLPDQLVSDGQFDNVRKIRQHDGPLLAMAGERDGLIPPPLVEELANANGGPTAYWLVEGSEHGIATRGVPEQGLRQYLDRLAEFLATTPCSSGS